MKGVYFFLFFAIVGYLVCGVLANKIQNVEIRFVFVGVFFISTTIYFAIKEIKNAKLVNNSMNQHIKKTKFGMMSVVNFAASLLYEGQTEEQIKKSLSAKKQHKVFVNEVIRQAKLIASPPFMSGNLAASRNVLLIALFMLLGVSVVIAYGLVYKVKPLTNSAIAIWVVALFLTEKMWRLASCPNYLSPLYETLVSFFKHEKCIRLKSLLVTYLINIVLIKHADATLDAKRFGIYQESFYDKNISNGYVNKHRSTHIVLKEITLVFHEFTGNMREPYFKEYTNFDDFFYAFLLARLEELCGSQRAFLPEATKAFAESHDNSFEGDVKVQKLRYFSDLSLQLKEKQVAYFSNQISAFMTTLRYRLIKNIIHI